MRRTIIFTLLVLTFGSSAVFLANIPANQQSNPGNDKSAQAIPTSVEHIAPFQGESFVAMDTNTWEILSLNGDQEAVRHLNTAEQKYERWKSTLAVLDPESYLAHFPKTDAEILAHKKAYYEAIHPKTWEEKQKDMTPSEIEEHERIRYSLEHPAEYRKSILDADKDLSP